MAETGSSYQKSKKNALEMRSSTIFTIWPTVLWVYIQEPSRFV